eukprot:CAMPEP_0173377830 /NCGR_PEP_ID=MMETSP1356-20130122/1116_1 /TAXON_ID=77927 ORGANISM="Hemiselmis virescens, Strain PCC157" /NCGR_SAMPLE_ID=MMETSP1356 /ASSEMBLY_ACC=CAM_ASM_000847 /LENGTH=240 /DNA_ID=CAMNT_0014330725 /DNA_START=14 /DNA_END=736 /DNA_ORIENTATION=+
MASYGDLVRPQQKEGGVSRRAWVVGAVVCGALALVAVAMVADGGVMRRATVLDSPPPLRDDEMSPKAAAAAKYAEAMAMKAHDNNDREGLAAAMKAAAKDQPKVKVAAAGIKKQSLSSRLNRVTPSEEKRNEEKVDEKANVMVPWVHWPGHPNTGGGDQFKASKANHKQQLLQMPMLSYTDKAAQLMPLKELIQRQIVDKSLHEGKVSDYELMAADQKANPTKSMARGSDSSAMDCAPFC